MSIFQAGIIQKKQRDSSSFEEAVKTADENHDIKLEFDREDQRYHDLVMKKPLNYLSDSDLDWRNQNVILLPFSKSDYFMLEKYNRDNDKAKYCSKIVPFASHERLLNRNIGSVWLDL